MNHSKWSYITVGVTAMGALMGALLHSWFCLFGNFLFAMINWHIAEAKRKLEDEILLLKHEAKKLGEEE